MSADTHQMSANPPADATGDGGGPATVASPVVNLTVTDVLNGAADLIERDGLYQSGRPDTSRGSCLWSATHDVACKQGPFSMRDVVGFLRHALDLPRAELPDFFAWNDAPERTKAEVVAVLRTAAERAA